MVSLSLPRRRSEIKLNFEIQINTQMRFLSTWQHCSLDIHVLIEFAFADCHWCYFSWLGHTRRPLYYRGLCPHRIGRTGQAGKKGVVHTFFMQENKVLDDFILLFPCLFRDGHSTFSFLALFLTKKCFYLKGCAGELVNVLREAG